MRPIIALVIAALIIGFVHQYTQFTERIRPRPVQFFEQKAAGVYDIRVICTFDAAGTDFGSPALSIKFRGQVLVEVPDRVAAGQVVEATDVPDIKVGPNEFLVQVTPRETGQQASSDSPFSLDTPVTTGVEDPGGIARAVRLEIRRDGVTVAQRNIWSSAPGPFGELVRLEVAGPTGEDDQ